MAPIGACHSRANLRRHLFFRVATLIRGSTARQIRDISAPIASATLRPLPYGCTIWDIFINTHLDNCSRICIRRSPLCIQNKIKMDNLIIYNSTTNGPDVLSIVTELFQATSQPYSYILQLLLPVVILAVMPLYIRTKPLVNYGRKQKANTPQSSNIWDEKAIQRSLKELGKKLEDMVLMPDLFVSWAAEPPRINPHYQEVKNEAEQWFGK